MKSKKGAIKVSKETTIVLLLIVAILIAQAFSVFSLNSKANSLAEQLNQTNEQLDLANKDLQNKINTLSDNIKSISSEQTSLQESLNKVKAEASSDFSGIIDEEIKGVVTIRTDAAQGTGFLITSDGYLITNAHVLSGASYANIYTYNGNKYSAELIGYNLVLDIALLKISGAFHALEFGDSTQVKIGEKVIAIGNPLGLSFSASEGIISAIDRTGDNGYAAYFQTDTALNPGNSGGPLINTDGKVIGINNFKISGADNLGFALESKHIIPTVNNIARVALNETII